MDEATLERQLLLIRIEVACRREGALDRLRVDVEHVGQLEGRVERPCGLLKRLDDARIPDDCGISASDDASDVPTTRSPSQSPPLR